MPPASRVASSTAEPTPALAGGSTLRIDSVAGAEVSPSPSPMSTISPTICPYDTNAGDSATQPNDDPSSSSPVTPDSAKNATVPAAEVDRAVRTALTVVQRGL